MDLKFLNQIGKMKHFNKGDFIFYEGEVEQCMYILIKGQVRLFVDSFGKEPVEIAILNPGSFFGEMALLTNSPRSATVCALEEDTIAIELSKESFYLLMEHQDDMAYKILSTLGQRVSDTLKKLPAYAQGVLENKQNQYNDLLQETDEVALKNIVTQKGYNIMEILQHYSQLLSDIDKEVTRHNEMKANTLSNYLDIVPKEHKNYKVPFPDGYEKYVLEKEMKCPICGLISKQYMVRTSLLKFEKFTTDMRSIYSPINPTWFELATCPNCLFTNSISQFEKVPDKYIPLTREALNKVSPAKYVVNIEEKTIDAVFTKHYLAITCTISPYLKDFKLGKLWLNLAWLYKDIQEYTLYEWAYEKAKGHYYKIFENSSVELSSSEEQKLYMIVAAFMCYDKRYRDAQKLYFDVTRIPQGNHMIEEMARDELEKVKRLLAKGE